MVPIEILEVVKARLCPNASVGVTIDGYINLGDENCILSKLLWSFKYPETTDRPALNYTILLAVGTVISRVDFMLPIDNIKGQLRLQVNNDYDVYILVESLKEWNSL